MEILLAIGIFAAAIVLLSLGSVLFRRPLKGSCGGVAGAIGEDATCDVCGRSTSDCPERQAE